MGLFPKISTSQLANSKRRVGGQNFYVDGSYGSDSSPGNRPEKPFLTLQKALNSCTAGLWDTIYITGGAIAGETTPFVLNKSCVRIIGDPYAVPQQSTNCAVIATGDTDVFTFAATDVSISGFSLYAGATAAGVGFSSVAWSQRNLIEKCAFVVGGYGVYADNIIDSPGHHLTIQDNLFMGSMGALGGINISSNGSWELIQRNHFDLLVGGNIVLSPSGVDAGRILNNTFMLQSDTEGKAITLGANCTRFWVMNNAANDNAVDAITANPFLDNGTTNVWVGNTKGGGAWTGIAPA